MSSLRTRTVLRPTIFGIVLVAILVVALVVRLAVADPSVAGLVWSGLAAAAVLGALWPLATVRSVGMTIVRAPTDLVVGQLSSVEIELSSRASGLTLRCAGSPLLVADVISPGVTRIPLEVAARGAYRSIRVDLGSDAPFGVALAQRGRTLELPRQLLVGPASIPTRVTVGELAGEQTDALPRGVSMTGESVRSVRPYIAGDPSHLVHWPTTARVGSLVVRELEPPVATGLAIVVDLSPPLRATVDRVEAAATRPSRGPRHWSEPPDRSKGAGSSAPGPAPGARPGVPGAAGLDLRTFLAIEQAASRAAGAAEDALGQGARVVLCTAEDAGPVVDEVVDLLGIRRRLALAVDGVPPSAPQGWPILRIAATDGLTK